jgi:hypothetical protein
MCIKIGGNFYVCVTAEVQRKYKTFETGTQVFIQLSAHLALLLLHVSAANCSHLQGATNVEDMYNVLCWLSNINGRIFMHTDDVRKCTLHE